MAFGWCVSRCLKTRCLVLLTTVQKVTLRKCP